MRRIGLIAAIAALGLGGGSSAATTTRPTLRLLDRQPFVVRGEHFRAGERVRVVLVYEQTLVRRAEAGRAGSFTVSFGQPGIGRCEAFFVRAKGSQGSRAILKLPLPPMCLPVASPG